MLLAMLPPCLLIVPDQRRNGDGDAPLLLIVTPANDEKIPLMVQSPLDFFLLIF
jgi:hypothetical protein